MYKLLIFILVVAILIPQPVLAKELEPIEDLPSWVNPECLTVMGKIIQHETGAMRDSEVFRFMAEQIAHDLKRYECANLTLGRWAIGPYSANLISKQVKDSIWVVALRWPRAEFCDCNFIGYPGDIPIWAAHGFNVDIGYQKTIGRLTVVGVDCNYVYTKNKQASIGENKTPKLPRVEKDQTLTR